MMPAGPEIIAATDATWPPAACTRIGPYTLRAGQGGGSRVSAATADPGAAPAVLEADLAGAEAWMAAQRQSHLFQVRAGDDSLDALLAARGYAVMDPVVGYVARTDALAAAPLKPLRTFRIWPPVAVQREIWQAGGIGPDRIAIMERAPQPKTTLLGRAADRPVSCAFVACTVRAGGLPLAMLHALETAPDARRQGMGRDMVVAVAHWAREQGAGHLALLVTRANVAANALYTGMGMTPATHYHYRIRHYRIRRAPIGAAP